MRTSQGSQRTTPASWPSSHMRWSTPVVTRQRKQRGWQERCCRTSFITIPRVRHPSRQWPYLTDDVQDIFLSILTNGKVTTDHVGPHSDLSSMFPYLGVPHAAYQNTRFDQV